MRPIRSRRAVSLACLMSLALSLTALEAVSTTAPAQGGSRYSFNRAERCLMRKINRRRAHHGRRKLNWDKQLGYVGRRHARNMADAGSTWHRPYLANVVTRWRRLGQTVGKAGRCRRMMRSFMRSSTHRQIIMGRWRFIGVGAIRKGGRIYVMQIFESKRNPGNIYTYP